MAETLGFSLAFGPNSDSPVLGVRNVRSDLTRPDSRCQGRQVDLGLITRGGPGATARVPSNTYRGDGPE